MFRLPHQNYPLRLIGQLFLMISICVVFTAGTVLIIHAATTQKIKNGPWETARFGHRVVPIIQPLHGREHQIYYSIHPHTPDQQIIKKAANDWSQLGIIKLVLVPWNDQRSQITVQYQDHSLKNPDGSFSDAETDPGLNYLSRNKRVAYLNHSTLTLYKNFSRDGKQTKYVVLAHEFGHTLGFAHDNRIIDNGKRYRNYTLIMNATGVGKTSYGLGSIEQQTLADHYHLRPQNWLTDRF